MLDSADSLVGCGHPEVPTPPGRQEELQYVVDGDDADHPVLIVYDRSCREVEVGHLPDDRVQVSVGPDRNRVDVGNFTDARLFGGLFTSRTTDAVPVRRPSSSIV